MARDSSSCWSSFASLFALAPRSRMLPEVERVKGRASGVVFVCYWGTFGLMTDVP